MAIFQQATNTPSKGEIIAAWLPRQPWAEGVDGPIELLGSFHLDDPDGRVGMQVHVVQAGDRRFQVPLTYRDAPVADMADALLTTMEHSALGTRHVYDGTGDERFLSVLAGVAVCGFGQALGFALVDGRWEAWPDTVRLRPIGALDGSIVVDGFERVASDPHEVVVRNERLELTLHRVLEPRSSPDLGLSATWPDQPEPMALVSVRLR